MRDLDLNLLQPLDALLQTCSVTRAAERMGLTQPTMSGILGRLRRKFGDELLVRIGRDMKLTPMADDLREEVHQILLKIDSVYDIKSRSMSKNLDRHFDIMLSEFGLFCIFPEVFKNIISVNTGVSVSILPIHEPAAGVYNGLADLCVTGEPIGEIAGEIASQLRVQTIMKEWMVGIVDENHPLNGVVSVEDILKFPHIATHFPGSKLTAGDISMLGYSQQIKPRLRIGGFMAIGMLVKSTDSIGVVPERIGNASLNLGGLKLIRLPQEFKPIDMHMIWHVRHEQDQAHRWIRSLVNDAAAKLRKFGNGLG